MNATVIIPCYKRPDWLRKTIDSILSQKERHLKEIVVVYQAEKDDEELRSWCSSKGVTYLFSSTPSTPRSRNIGVENSTGEICIFFDDDVELLSECIRHHVDSYQDGVVGVAGRVITVREAGEDQVLERGNKIGHVNRWARVEGDQQYNSLTRMTGKITPLGCNMSFLRSAIEQVGGFDESYVGNAMREETDLAVRALQLGDIVFEPRAAVKHFLAKGGGSRQKPKSQWYKDFFFNESYFISKFTSGRPKFIAYLRLWKPLMKYLIRCGREGGSLIAPYRQIRDAQLKARSNG